MITLLKLISFAIIALFAVALIAPEASAAKQGEVTRVVVLWLKQPGNVEHENALIRAANSFRRIHGVTRVEVGRALPIKTPGIDQAFDLCAVFTFKDEAALAHFQSDKRHLQAIELFLKPLVRKYVVYNFVSE